MNSRRIKLGLFWLAVGLVAAGGFFLHQENGRLQTRVVELRRAHRGEAFLRAENARMRTLLKQAERQARDGDVALQLELVQTRKAVEEIEQRAEAVAARKAAEAAELAVNGDPERGLARLEHFRNMGRATPAAALQTLVWAAMKGDERALAEMLVLSGEAAEKAQQLWARLPTEARTRYPGPEALAAIALTGEMLKADAIQVLGTTFVDGQHASVRAREQGGKNEVVLPMELGPDGWKMVVPDKAINALKNRMKQVSVESKPKK